MPPCTWIERSHAATAASAANAFAAAAATGACSSSSATHHAAQYASERASSTSVYVLRELVRDGLVDADRLAELLARLRVLDAELERALRDADRLGGHRGAEARRLLDASADAAKRTRRVDGPSRSVAVDAKPFASVWPATCARYGPG